MKCEKCGAQFYEKCDKHVMYPNSKPCGMSYYLGSSNAEHTMSRHMNITALGGNGLFKRSSEPEKYLPWEAPEGSCPSCWHKENPTKEAKPIPSPVFSDKLRLLL